MKKSLDFDIRAEIVTNLLRAGLKREQIRHELTLDSNSSDGRVDIAVLLPNLICAIEIKSGSDTLERLKEQMSAYAKYFDTAHIVADKKHAKGLAERGYTYYPTLYCHEKRCFVFEHRGIFVPAHDSQLYDYSIFSAISNRKSTETSPGAMCRLLWAVHAKEVGVKLGIRYSTRYAIMKHIQENVSLAQLRPLLVEMLMKRDKSSYESSFWDKYDKLMAGVA